MQRDYLTVTLAGTPQATQLASIIRGAFSPPCPLHVAVKSEKRGGRPQLGAGYPRPLSTTVPDSRLPHAWHVSVNVVLSMIFTGYS